MHVAAREFLNDPGCVQGWECGNLYKNADFPACPPGAGFNVRLQTPSYRDGLHLDSPDPKRRMAYPVAGRRLPGAPVEWAWGFVSLVERLWPLDAAAGEAISPTSRSAYNTTATAVHHVDNEILVWDDELPAYKPVR